MSSTKYLLIAKNTLQEYFVYRANFVFWRLQVLVSFIISYLLWAAVAGQQNQLGSYSLSQIYNYFVIGYIVRAIVFSTRTADIGGDIQNGNLSMLILKPIGTIKYYFSRDLVDKLFNLVFMIVELSVILIILHPQFIIPKAIDFVYFLISLIFAILIFFFYSLIISFSTFWTDQAWPSRFLFGVVLVSLLSGQYIPLDLLPSAIFECLKYTPYPYLHYYPMRLWLGQESNLYPLIAGSSITLIISYLIAVILWRFGKRKYQGYGN